MGFFKDNTIELEVDGKIIRVFKHEAETVKANLIAKGRKVKIKDQRESDPKKPENKL